MTESVVDRARLLVGLGRCREAVELLWGSGGDVAQSASAKCVLAQAHLGLDEPAEALEACDAALDEVPDHIDALRFRASALSRLGRCDEALESATAAVSRYPSSALARMTLAACQLDAGQMAEARQSAADAVAIAPADANTHALAGRVALAAGDLDDAEVELRRALSIDPHRGDVLNNLGIVGLRRGDYAVAEERFVGAVQLTGSEIMAENVVRAQRAHRFQRARWWRTPLLFVVFFVCIYITFAFNNPLPGIVISGLIVAGLRISVSDPVGSWPARARAAGRGAARVLPIVFVAGAIAGIVDGPIVLTLAAVPLGVAAFLGGQTLRQRHARDPRVRRPLTGTALEAGFVLAGGISLWAIVARDDPYVLTTCIMIWVYGYLGNLIRTGQIPLSPTFRKIARALAIVVLAYLVLLAVSVLLDGDPLIDAGVALVLAAIAFELQRFLRPARHPGHSKPR